MIKKRGLIPVLFLFILLFLVISGILFFIPIQPVKALDPSLHVVGTHLEDGDGNNVTLRSITIGWNERRKVEGGTWEADDPYSTWFSASDVVTFKAHNANCIEIQHISFKYIMNTKNVFNTQYFVDWCDVWVNWATNNEMYIILDITTFWYSASWTIPSWIWSSAGYSQPTTKAQWDTVIRDFFDTDVSAMDSNRVAFINAWKGIANRYKNNDYVLFNIMDEPLMGVDKAGKDAHLGETYSDFIEAVVDGIHSTGSENIIMVDIPFIAYWATNTDPVDRNGIMWRRACYIDWSVDYTAWETYMDDYVDHLVSTFGKPYFDSGFGFAPKDVPKSKYPSTWFTLLTDQIDYLNSSAISGANFHEWGNLHGEIYDYLYDLYTESETNDILDVIFNWKVEEEEQPPPPPPPPPPPETPEVYSVSISLKYPIQAIYPTSTIPVEIYAEGGTIDRIWYNSKNGSNWIYVNNLTYTSPTTMTNFVDGNYVFYAWANNTDGNSNQQTTQFSVCLSFFNSSTLFDYNLELMGSGFPYLLNSTGKITSLLFEVLRMLSFKVFSEETTSLTLIDATDYGEPISISGASSEYYEEYSTVAINASHSSEEEIIIIWEHSYGEGASTKAPSNALVYGSNFGLTFNAGDSLALCGNYPLLFEVKSGLWNGSSGAITVYADRGRFSFYAENNTVLEVLCPDAPSGLDLSVSGASYTQPSKFVWLVTITTNNTVSFVWNWRLVSWLDLYFMFGVGMAGLIMMVFAPSWVAMGVRRNAFQVDKVERIGYAVLIFCVGFGLFCSWLWS